MKADEIKRLTASARVARLATVGRDGRPHVVPITFALVDDRLYTAVDHKPKSTRRLKRIENIASEPRVCVLVDHYDEDWKRLWWCRLDGRAFVTEQDADLAEARGALGAKYPQYRQRPPEGPAVVVDIERWYGWSPSDSP